MRRRHHLLTVVLAAVALVLGVAGATPALAAPTSAAVAHDDTGGAIGYDISNYQCGDTLPANPQFAVIEAEGAPYAHTTSASCLQQQYAYAAAAPGAPNYYVYTADTSYRGGSHTITDVCGSSPSDSCAYSYAEGAAQDAVQQLDAAGIPVTATTWWLDTECNTSSCPDWSSSTELNQQAILGYVAGLRSRPDRVSAVGVYSTNYQWGHITGQTNGSPDFGADGLPVWYASAAQTPGTGASSWCGQPGFTGGQIALVQSAPINYAGSSSEIDPDVLCQPSVPSVTQNVVAGGLVTATGVGRPGTTLTLLLADSFTPAKAFANVTTDSAGHWTQGFHLGSDGVLTVDDPDGTSTSVAIAVTAKVNVSKTRSMGRDRLGHCIDRLDGSTYPYVAGTRAILRGSRDKQVGFGKVTKLGVIGSWYATVIVPCGKASTTKVTYSGLVPGNGVRFATDGRTAAVKLPVTKTPPKR